MNPALRMAENLMGGDGSKWDDGCVSVVPTDLTDSQPSGNGVRHLKATAVWVRRIQINTMPIWAGGSVHLNGARPWEKETDCHVAEDCSASVTITEQNGAWMLHTNLDAVLPQISCKCIVNEVVILFEYNLRSNQCGFSGWGTLFLQ